ncbi:MAG: hypothetical protein KatS3mg105_0920 [Gemmatales bacterium]|nr:MAG: hypothetical protein KatS3mg105_0920 [Gemmatales bacterium]
MIAVGQRSRLLTVVGGVCLALIACSDPQPDVDSTRLDSSTKPKIAEQRVVLRGRVTWEGPLPDIAVLDIRATPLAPAPLRVRLQVPNPNAPAIDPKSRGIQNAVVFLRHVDPDRCRPWHHPPVRIEQVDYRIRILQGDVPAPVGFVRRGDEVLMVSRQNVPHNLRATGAAFFTLAFPDPHQPLMRRFHRSGLVELSSGTGFYWMRGYLFVSDHPYYTRTDASGSFRLEDVPPGDYEIVCWLPNWHITRRARSPESGQIIRTTFAPPVEKVQTRSLVSRDEYVVGFQFRSADFAPGKSR